MENYAVLYQSLKRINEKAKKILESSDPEKINSLALDITYDVNHIMPDDNYNGWTNRATWACNLYLYNEVDQDTIKEIIQELEITECTPENAARIVQQCFPFGIRDLDDCISQDNDDNAGNYQCWNNKTHYNPIYANLHGDIDYEQIAEGLNEFIEEIQS